MVRELIHDPIRLAAKSAEATAEDTGIASDLLDTLRAHSETCVGMAANMIGVKKNIIVVSVGFLQMVMVNGVIVAKDGPYETEEGCLSLLGGPRKTTRYEEIEIEYLDADFRTKKAKFNGWTAQIIQHGLDHVHGVLI